MTEVNVRWDKAPSFAEIAEALDVNTDQIMAAMRTDDRYTVMYSPVEDEPNRIFHATLCRDHERILRPDGPAEEIPGMWDEIVRSIEDRMP